LKVCSDRIEEEVADGIANGLYVFAGASVGVGGEVAVDVNMTDRGCVENDGPAVPRAESIELGLILRKGLGVQVVEEFIFRVGSINDLGQFAQLDLRNIGEEGAKGTMDLAEVGVALEDRPGEEGPGQGRITAFGFLTESFQRDSGKSHRHAVAVGKAIELELVSDESEGTQVITVPLDESPCLGKSREDVIEVLMFGRDRHCGM